MAAMKNRLIVPAILAVAAAPAPAFAHPFHAVRATFAGGVAHPFGGVDHVAAALAVGLVAWQLRRRGGWAFPFAFLAALAAGWALASGGGTSASLDLLLVGSVAVLGAVVLRAPVATAALALAVTVLGFVHGAAHGGETAATSAVAWGLVAGTALLVAAGVGLGAALERARSRHLARSAGLA
jgi:urease accessory protein